MVVFIFLKKWFLSKIGDILWSHRQIKDAAIAPPGPPGRFGHGGFSARRGTLKRGRVPGATLNKSSRINYYNGHIMAQRPTTTTPAWPLTLHAGSLDYDIFADEDSGFSDDSYYDQDQSEEEECLHDQCKIELFTKTLLRGDSVELWSNSTRLLQPGFDNKVTSLRVSGPCVWELYKDADFEGTSKTFAEGSYRNAVALGKLLRKASSVKNIGCR